MYRQQEITGFRKTWVAILADMVIGQRILLDKEDRKRVASSVSTNFHKPKKAKFRIYMDKSDNELYIERLS